MSNEKIKEKVDFDDRKFDTVDIRYNNRSADKYDEYKREIIDDFEKQKHGLTKSNKKHSNKKQEVREEEMDPRFSAALRESRYQR